MLRVMLVIDDFNELAALEALLRRIGFDVLSLGKDVLVNDALLRFHPDLVLASQKGRAVDGMKLAMRMKTLKPAPLVALQFTGAVPQITGDAKKAVDAVIESPMKPRDTIEIIAKLISADPAPMLARFEKFANATMSSNDGITIVGSSAEATARAATTPAEWDPRKTPGLASSARSARSDRYDKFLNEHDEPPVSAVLPHEAAAKAMAKLKKDAEADKAKLEKLDEEKRAFAKALFESNDKARNKKKQR